MEESEVDVCEVVGEMGVVESLHMAGCALTEPRLARRSPRLVLSPHRPSPTTDAGLVVHHHAPHKSTTPADLIARRVARSCYRSTSRQLGRGTAACAHSGGL